MAATKNLLTLPINITAIVAYNDYMAAGALAVIHDKGIAIPEALSIIGFDDGLLAHYLYPALTTVHYPIALMAEKAALLALKLANGLNIEPEHLHFTPSLVIRNSVTKIKA